MRENNNARKETVKTALYIFHVGFWFLGLALIVVAVTMRNNSSIFEVLTHRDPADIHRVFGKGAKEAYHAPGYVVLAIGCAINILGIIGCCGVIRESPTSLLVYSLFLIFVFGILIGVVSVFLSRTVLMRDQLVKFLEHEVVLNDTSAFMAYFSSRFKCCGVHEEDICSQTIVSIALCPEGSSKCSENTCFSAFWDRIRPAVRAFTATVLVTIVFSAIGIVLSLYLCVIIKRATYPFEGI